MLPCRINTLIALYDSYKILKIPLMIKIADKILPGCASCDDPGLFLYAPIVSSLFDVDISVGASYFFTLLGSVFLIGSIVGVFYLTKSKLARCFSILLLSMFFYKLLQINDVYIVYSLPLSLALVFLSSLKDKAYIRFMAALLFSGLLSSVASITRILSYLPLIMFFSIIMIFTNNFKIKYKIYGLLLFFIGFSVPKLHFNYAIYQKNNYLYAHNVAIKEEQKHVFWHNAYIGFGFTRNPYDIVWDDTYAKNAAKKINIECKVGTPLYEKTIKNLIFGLLKNDRHFFLTSLFARFGVVVMFFLLWFGWLGLFFSYFYLKPWYQELAFLSALGASALPGIATIPRFEYLAGFITCTVLYTIYSVIFAFNNGLLKDVEKYYEKNINNSSYKQ